MPDTRSHRGPLHERQVIDLRDRDVATLDQQDPAGLRERPALGPVARRERPALGRPGGADGPPAGRERWAHVLTAVFAIAALVVVAVVHYRGMYQAPIRFDDEGTYVSQAQSLLKNGTLAPYTYWYDHPPLGWMLLAGWLALPDFLGHAPNLIGAGRQFMLVLDLALVLLTFALARRIGASRVAAAGAMLLVGLSPLALNFHRMVLLDNIAVPAVIAAFVLTLSPQRRLSAAFGAGLLISIAALCKETTALMAPFVLWSLWRHVHGTTRRMCIAVFVIGATLPLVLYPLYALLKGELVPGAGHVSLVSAIEYQLFSRTGSGSVLQQGTDAWRVVHGWLAQDPYLVPGGVIGGALAVFLPGRSFARLRPIAAALVVSALLLLRPGYLPVPYVVAMIPLAALVVVVLLDRIVTRLFVLVRDGAMPGVRMPRRVVALGSLAALVTVLVGGWTVARNEVAPYWYYRDLAAQRVNFDRPYQLAAAYILSTVPRDSTLVVDNVLWTDLHDRGYPRHNLVWFTKIDADPDVESVVSRWQDIDYIASSDIIRTSREAGQTLREALKHSTVVATWGSGSSLIELRKVKH